MLLQPCSSRRSTRPSSSSSSLVVPPPPAYPHTFPRLKYFSRRMQTLGELFSSSSVHCFSPVDRLCITTKHSPPTSVLSMIVAQLCFFFVFFYIGHNFVLKLHSIISTYKTNTIQLTLLLFSTLCFHIIIIVQSKRQLIVERTLFLLLF